MSNHVHLIAVPHTAVGMAQALKQAHGRYASYWNAHHSSSGHVWQGRFYSCPLDDSHLWKALRYVELNPVRAGIVEAAPQWRWSSAAAHCGGTASRDAELEMEQWRKRWTAIDWTAFLAQQESPMEIGELRRSTHTRTPFRNCRLRGMAGEVDSASAGSPANRPTQDAGRGYGPGGDHICCLRIGECPVCPRITCPTF
jgi:putative transposase